MLLMVEQKESWMGWEERSGHNDAHTLRIVSSPGGSALQGVKLRVSSQNGVS